MIFIYFFLHLQMSLFYSCLFVFISSHGIVIFNPESYLVFTQFCIIIIHKCSKWERKEKKILVEHFSEFDTNQILPTTCFSLQMQTQNPTFSFHNRPLLSLAPF